MSGALGGAGDLLRAAARRVAAPLLGVPVRLPAALLERYPELGEAAWRRGGLPPRIGGWCLLQSSAAAITLWRTVYLAPDTGFDPRLLLHELRHVHQFQASPWFPLHYIWQSIRRGYGQNPYEADADAYAARRLRGGGPPPPGGTSPLQDA